MKTGVIFALWEGSQELPGKNLHEAFQLEALSTYLVPDPGSKD